MLLMGDEVRRTQQGNNNAYCQDEISWFDWRLRETHDDIHRFVKTLIAARQGGRLDPFAGNHAESASERGSTSVTWG